MADPILANAGLITIAALVSSFMSFALGKVWDEQLQKRIGLAKQMGWTFVIVVISLLVVYVALYVARPAIF